MSSKEEKAKSSETKDRKHRDHKHRDKSESKEKSRSSRKDRSVSFENGDGPNLDSKSENGEDNIPEFCFNAKKSKSANQILELTDTPFSVSPEFDGKFKKAAQTKIDRSYWETELYRLHPEIRDLVTRVDPVSRAATIASLFLPSRRLLPQEGVLALIVQHLKTVGLPVTAAEIENNLMFSIDYPPHHQNSQLVHHLERGIISADGFYNLLLPTPGYPNDPDTVKKQLATHASSTLGVIGIKKSDDTKIIDDKDLAGYVYNPEDKLPRLGTTNQLVWVACRRDQSEHPFAPQLIDIFAMTYHTFMTSHHMFRKLQEALEKLFDEAKDMKPSDRDKAELYYVALVEKWMEKSFYDFDSMLIQNLNQWLNSIEFQNKGAKRRLLTAFQKQISGEMSKKLLEFDIASDINLPRGLFSGQFELVDMDMDELARQITMYAGKFYYAITEKELLDCAWSKPRIRHRAPNVCAITSHFNCLNQWVQHEILFAETLEKRFKLWELFTRLAQKFWDNQDYFDGMAIATAFQANPIYRLKNHKQLLSPNVMDPIDKIMNDARSEKNFAALQQLHNDALKKGSGTVIPYVGVYLTQLTFFYDGNKDYQDGLVNFQKCAGIYTLVTKILSFQTKEFTYSKIDQVQKKLAELPLWDSAFLSERSMQIEPKDMTLDQLKKMYAKETGASTTAPPQQAPAPAPETPAPAPAETPAAE
ncbi:RasGEF domain containing protein [Trichomonas vaginalis G3]|uniref:RasGEF domain containing protein n=1 Tax=Trichomonas vaginalis (strain ATCC PRA-98 / G3) TaxID=412133 RepID=A2ETX5_TRIV3|nr:guanyl-nucleotide exchange factor protein [Trichomonas vaginalis G3]EAY03863.1 RasGEF domain containing protein [Trichomonas vaginalis G3]KAI5552968.1 guanyl-nucleotide exchange factor protein [Trichomonas vaginalis G3]|eukprot:XP_001316086.1 RasGEF domain containing protein [Trichomonas vaginalis G3]